MSLELESPKPRRKPAVWPKELAYPRINVAPGFEVVRDWPNRPEDFLREAVSGAWVDEQDRVWLYTRGTPAMQVYSAAGHYLFSWPGDSQGGAHHLEMDAEGHVWLANLEAHTVPKFIPGKR